jgi:hypothetical protein
MRSKTTLMDIGLYLLNIRINKLRYDHPLVQPAASLSGLPDRSCQGIKASAFVTCFLATIPSREIVSACFVLFSRIRRKTACVYVCVPL